jgi:hypothetical protein
MSDVFIVEAVIDGWLDLDASFRLLKMQALRVEKKFSPFFDPSTFRASHLLRRNIPTPGM